MAIHYADVSPARRRGMNEYRQLRDDCMNSLFAVVARNHGLDLDVVRASTAMRNRWFDAMVLASFVAVYALVAYALAGVIVQRSSADDWRVVAVAVIGLSLGAAVVAVMSFGIWTSTADSLRLNSWHLSYRENRLPWRHYGAWFVPGFAAVFWLMALLRYRRRHRSPVRAA